MGGVTATEYFCTPLVDVYNGYDQFDGGNTGVKVVVTAAGTLDSLTLSNPGGIYNPSFTQNAVLTASQTVGHGHNTYVLNTYMVCVFTGSPSFPWGPLTGTWTMTLNGAFSEATLAVQASIPGGYPQCPAGQQR